MLFTLICAFVAINSLQAQSQLLVYENSVSTKTDISKVHDNGLSPTMSVVGAVNPCAGTTTVTDYDGNVYKTLLLGKQCWMKSNLRTKHYADGTAIALGDTYSDEVAYRYYPNENSGNVATYGYLYNWKAVMHNATSSEANPSGVQGICPKGWHVPSDAEWIQLTEWVISQNKYQCGDESDYVAKALASTSGWAASKGDCEVGNNQTTNNATGFGAVPAGRFDGGYSYCTQFAYFWSTTEYDSDGYSRGLGFNNALVLKRTDSKGQGLSVRCIRN